MPEPIPSADASAASCNTGQPDPKPKPGSNARPKRRLTRAQRAANRRNAQKSTGPRTPEGKAVCRQNALKHGLSGAGVVVHPADREELKTRLGDWTEALNISDPLEAWLVGRAALASVRLDRCARQEQVRLADRQKNAAEAWLARERATAETVSRELDRQPAHAVGALFRRAVGCEWLIQQWETLQRPIRAGQGWTKAQLDRAVRLLCQTEPPKFDHPDEALANFWLAGLAVLDPADVNPADVEAFLKAPAEFAAMPMADRMEHLRLVLPAREPAREELLHRMDRMLTTLRNQAEKLWAEVDGPLRRDAQDRVLCDVTEDAQVMGRYERANSLEVHRCLKLLFQKRREESAERNRQAQSNANASHAASARTQAAHEVARRLRTNSRARRRRQNPTNGHTRPLTPAAPFVMPRPLAERVSHEVAVASEAASPAPQFRPGPAAAMTQPVDAPAGSAPAPAAPVEQPIAGEEAAVADLG